MKLQNRLKSYTVVLLLSPLLFLGVAEWRDWQKECERTLHRAKNTRENGVRSPRIYFMQGLYGVIYPLFFDPYHEITK